MYEGNSVRAPILGTKELLDGYSSMPWLRAAAGRVADAVAATDWELFAPGRRTDNDPVDEPYRSSYKSCESIARIGNFKSRTKHRSYAMKARIMRNLDQHPLLTMLQGGNDFMPGQQVMKLTQIHLDLAGEGFWLLERNVLGVPTSAYPLVPTWIYRLPTRENPTYGMQAGAIRDDIPITEIIRFQDPNPADPFGRGSGLARTLADELQTDEYAAKLTKLRFVNSGRPDIIVSADDLQKEEVDRLEQNWLTRTSGFFNRFRPFFAARKLDVKVISQTFADMQVMELRQMERNAIIQVWGMPPEMLGVLTNSNRATIHSADFIFSAWVIVPRLELIRQTLQFKLVPMFDSKLYLDYESPISEDKEFQLMVMKVAPKAFTLDEFREIADMMPLPKGAGTELYDPGVNAHAAPSAGGIGLPGVELGFADLDVREMLNNLMKRVDGIDGEVEEVRGRLSRNVRSLMSAK